MIEVRDTPEGILLTRGDIQDFRAWPMTTREAARLVRRLLALRKVETAWFNLPTKEQK